MNDDSSADRWERLDELFYAASEMDPAERTLFVASNCGEDVALRAELEALLRASEYTHGFLEKPLSDAARLVVAGADQAGQLIGRYRLIRELGEGGMGRVYLAVRADEHYQQQVAIKIMHGGLAPSNTMLLRFRTERQILANLQHPNIARLLDGGVTEAGLPYLVMEYVNGVPIHKYCEGRSIEERLKLFRTVCGAVEYAHANLVVHRDIKPLNILVTADGTPKLLDFGIAKLLDPNFAGTPPGQRTYATDRLMTPEYASPEQILGEPITTATDVYALGTLLYELLSGAQPFAAQKLSPLAFARFITEVDPEPPSVAAARSAHIPGVDARRMRGDLDNVVRTAMRKEPARRYASVAQFSADVEAYLEGYPLRAGADSWRYRAGKFLGRHKRGTAVTAAVFALLIGSTIEMAVLARRARREQAVAQQETQFLASVFSASTPEESRGTTITARDLLDRGTKRIDRELAGQPEVQASMLESIAAAYRSVGQYDQALALAQRSYALQTKLTGGRNEQMAGVLDLVAELYRDKAQYDKAEPLFGKLVDVRRRIDGNQSAAYALTLSNFGECLYNDSKDSEAEPMLREALAIYKRQGPDAGTAVRDYLALVLERKGNFQEAAQLLRESTEITLRTLGPNHPDYAISLHNLASDLIDLGDLDGAEAKLREALAATERSFGKTHPQMGYSLNNLGYVLIEKGRAPAAAPYLQQAVAISLMHNGPNHPRTAAYRSNLTRVLLAEGKFDAAEKGFREALGIMTSAHANNTWAAAQMTAYLGLIYFDRGQYAEAEKLARQAMEIRKKLGGEQSPAYASSLVEIAQDRLFQHDPSGAEPLLTKAVQIRRTKYSPHHPDTVAAEVRLGEALLAEKKYAEAEPVLREAAVAAQTTPYAPLPWEVAEAQNVLGACLIDTGKVKEGESLLKQSQGGVMKHPRPALRRQAPVLVSEFQPLAVTHN